MAGLVGRSLLSLSCFLRNISLIFAPGIVIAFAVTPLVNETFFFARNDIESYEHGGGPSILSCQKTETAAPAL